MSLTAGTRLGPYEIQSAIGAGGMGEVYKARDTRLDRTVAIKILPPALAGDVERRARFEREAKTIAALTHPHICALHDVGDHPSTGPGQTTLYLVMEYLAGETLAERLRRGPLPLAQALMVATEIADALAAAHRQGVIHRDLKPGNVMLTKAGTKLLDFGLAKLKPSGAALAVTATMSVATQEPATAAGTLLGTVPYMAPEQLEGNDADARSDIFSFGAVLYEMLTGKRAFEGKSHASVVAAILERDPPPPSSIVAVTPPLLDRLVRQCLAKSPDDRPDTAHDIARELRWMRETDGAAPAGVLQPRRRFGALAAVVVATSLALFAAGLGVMWWLRPAAPAAPLAWVGVDVRPAEEINAGGLRPTTGLRPSNVTPGGSRTALTWTPNGRALVFVGRRGGVQQLYVRRLDSSEARALPNTDGAEVPAVSSDGQWVAFWAPDAIRKVPLSGGPAMVLASIDVPPWGLTWTEDGRLFFGHKDNRIWEIPVRGAPKALTTPDEAVRHSLPSPLPGGRVLLYTVRKRTFSWGDEEIVAQTLRTGTRQVLLKDAADARYLPTGHLVFLRRGELFAVPFDADRLQVRGSEVPVLDTVAQALSETSGYELTGAGQFAVSPVGDLAWLSGPVVPYADGSLVTVDRAGRVSTLPAQARSYAPGVRLSPDGRRLAVAILSHSNRGLWLYDLGRHTLAPLLFGGDAFGPRWSPDRQRLVFTGLINGRSAVMSQPVDSTAPPQILAAGRLYPSSFTPDGRQLAAVQLPAFTIVIVTLEDGQVRVERLTEATSPETCPEFSPDGHWLAYASQESGHSEVYVQAYPTAGAREQVSVAGGENPAWNPNGGRELFFLSLDDAKPLPTGKRRMMAVDFEPGSPPRRPRPLFEFDGRDLNFTGYPLRNYDVSPDGQRFYSTRTPAPAPAPVVTHINLIQNWFEELKAKVPVQR